MAPIAIHPGEHLSEELDALKMSATELARRLEVPTNRVTGVLNGQRPITGATALRLPHFFGTSAQFWLNLQHCMNCAWPRPRPERPSKSCRRSSIRQRPTPEDALRVRGGRTYGSGC